MALPIHVLLIQAIVECSKQFFGSNIFFRSRSQNPREHAHRCLWVERTWWCIARRIACTGTWVQIAIHVVLENTRCARSQRMIHIWIHILQQLNATFCTRQSYAVCVQKKIENRKNKMNSTNLHSTSSSVTRAPSTIVNPPMLGKTIFFHISVPNAFTKHNCAALKSVCPWSPHNLHDQRTKNQLNFKWKSHSKWMQLAFTLFFDRVSYSLGIILAKVLATTSFYCVLYGKIQMNEWFLHQQWINWMQWASRLCAAEKYKSNDSGHRLDSSTLQTAVNANGTRRFFFSYFRANENCQTHTSFTMYYHIMSLLENNCALCQRKNAPEPPYLVNVFHIST